MQPKAVIGCGDVQITLGHPCMSFEDTCAKLPLYESAIEMYSPPVWPALWTVLTRLGAGLSHE
jgi:hypothetical protein